VWRKLHYTSFAVFALTLAHSVFAGSDTGTIWAQGLYAFSCLSLVGLTIYRIGRARRRPEPTAAGLSVGAVRFDPIARIVTVADGRKVNLRITEANLLYYLLQNTGRPLKAEQILAGVWGQGYRGESKLVDGYIRRLRARIESNQDAPVYIRTVEPGVYLFDGSTSPLSAGARLSVSH
jgi:hypothetical protein